MANHISHAALPYPIKGCRFTLLVPFLDADGDPTDPTTPDTERSIDGAAYADCTEEVTTISGSNGSGYITLTGDETNGSAIMIAAKVTSGPKATLATLYPRVLPIFASGTAQAGAAGTLTLASGASAIDDYYNGCIIRTTGGTGGAGGSGSLGNQARVVTDYVGSTKVATISPSWETTPDSTTTYEVLLCEMALISFANAVQMNATALTARDIGASVLLSSGSGTGQLDFTSGVVKSNLAQILGTALTETAGLIAAGFKQFFNIGSPTSTMNTITTTTNLTNAPTAGDLTATMKTSVTTAATAATPIAASVSGAVGSIATGGIASVSFAAGAINAAAIATDAIGASELAADAIAEIQSGLSTLDAAGVRTAVGLASANLDTQLTTIDDFLDTEVAAIKAKTDLIPAAPAAVGDIPTANANADALLDRTAGVETSRTVRQALRLMLAALGGKLSGAATTTVTIRDTNDSKDRIVAVVDSDGNRSSITYDAS